MIKEIDAKISIDRAIPSNGKPFIHIEIEGVDGIIIAVVQISPEDFGNAVTGLGGRKCKCITYAEQSIEK